MQAAPFMGDEHVAGMNGKAKDLNKFDSKPVMVHQGDLERSMLEVSLQAVRDNPNVRRPDGRKSPYMLCAEEAMRLRLEVTAMRGQLATLRQVRETLEAQLKLALSDEKIVLLEKANQAALEKCQSQIRLIEYWKAVYQGTSKTLDAMFAKEGLRETSGWVRLGRRLGFYR